MSTEHRLPTLAFEQLMPMFCRPQVVLRVMVLAQAVAILLSLAPHSLTDFWPRLGFTSLFVHWVALVTLALLCWCRQRLVRFSAIQLAVLTICTLLVISTLLAVFSFYSLVSTTVEPSSGAFWSFLLRIWAMTLLVGVMVMQLFGFYIEQSERLAAQSRSELDALQARIQPHFLFNSLNTAAELTQQDPVAAETALLNLASLFRAAMAAGQQVSLAQELQLSQQYLALEQWRLADKLTMDWQLPAVIPTLNLPALTLQPLFENAIRHGVEKLRAPSTIRVELYQSTSNVTFLLTNPIPQQLANEADSASNWTHLHSNGIALANIRRRLQLQFGESAQLSTHQSHDEFRVKMVLPLTSARSGI